MKSTGTTALITATVNKRIDIARLLIDKGADLDKQNMQAND